MVRKALNLIFVLLLSINSFAAAVSDNDGSAFITKAEFDSLKNNFQTQINLYNTSIDAKIDDAIASYLAGVTVGAESNKEFQYKSWKQVTQMNYKPTVTWRVPSLDLSMAMNENLGNTAGWSETCYSSATVVYDRPEANKQKILVCDAGTELTLSSGNGPEYITWVGRSINYKDKIYVNLSGTNTSGYYQGVANGAVRVYYWARFNPGYYSNMNTSANTIWNPNFYYWHTSNSSYRKTMSTNWTSKVANASVELESNSDGDQYDYPHIITWGTFTNWRFCDKTWTKHLCKNPEGKTTDDYGSSTRNGNYAIMEAGTAWEGSTGRVTGTPAFYKGEGTNSYSVNTPTVGLLNNEYNVKNVYQINEKFKERVDGSEIESSEKPILPDGFPMFAAKKGDKITWTPSFIKSTKGSATDLKDKIALYLSVGPMGDTYDLKNSSSKRIKDKDNNEYFVIKDNSEKITFEMPADGIVYAKWCHEPIYSGNWEITLDLETCGVYKREKGVK